MTSFILGKKLGMSQIFNEDGKVFPSTVLEIRPMIVTQVKTPGKDGYSAVQVGIVEKKSVKLKNPQKGHLKDIEDVKLLREFQIPEDKLSEFKRGKKIDGSIFSEGSKVSVSALSKGKGFQGVVKRHGFAGGPRSHGQKHSEREPGSIGIGGVQRVLKGKKMAGRMGGERVTVKNLEVLKVSTEDNQILVSGAVPGRRGTLVEIRLSNL